MKDSVSTHAVRRDLIAAAVLIVFGLWIVSVSLKIPLGVATDPLGPRTFPTVLGAGIALCGILLAGGVLFFRGASQGLKVPGEPDPEEEVTGGGPFSLPRFAGAVALTAAYLAAFVPLGYLVATTLYVLAVMLLHGGAPRRGLALTPPLVAVSLFFVFRYGLRIPLPDGILASLMAR